MSELTDRMRTCAAHLVSKYIACDDKLGPVIRDAADLLIEAAYALEKLTGPIPYDDEDQPIGEPMEIIEPSHTPIPPSIDRRPSATWVAAGDALPVANPYRSRHTCPRCDSRATKTVRRVDNTLMLVCPVCSNEWQYQPEQHQ